MVLAQVEPVPSSAITDFEQFLTLLTYISNFIFTLLMILAIIFILIAAFNYLTAMGDQNKLATAKSMLVYAAVAIAVALLAAGVRFMIDNLLLNA